MINTINFTGDCRPIHNTAQALPENCFVPNAVSEFETLCFMVYIIVLEKTICGIISFKITTCKSAGDIYTFD